MSRLHRARPDYFCEAHGKRESDVSFFSICIQHSYFCALLINLCFDIEE